LASGRPIWRVALSPVAEVGGRPRVAGAGQVDPSSGIVGVLCEPSA
jgi:hypothetical protein